MIWHISISENGIMRVEAAINDIDQATAFVRAFNGACTVMWPDASPAERDVHAGIHDAPDVKADHGSNGASS